MAQQSQSEDPMDALAHAAQEKLFTPGEGALTEWEMGLVLHHWTIQRITAQLASADMGRFALVRRHAPGLGVGAAVGAIVIFIKDLLTG